MERVTYVRTPTGSIIGAAVRNEKGWTRASGRAKASDFRSSSSPRVSVGSGASPTITRPKPSVTTAKSSTTQRTTPTFTELRSMVNNNAIGDWQIIGQKTKAKVTRSFVQNGERRTEEEWPVGTPNEVKQAVAPKYQGEVTEVEWVYTNTDLRRYVHENTTHGITKRDEFRTIQSADFGDGRSVKTNSNPSGAIYHSEENQKVMEQAIGKPTDKVDYLKNMHDKLQDQVTQQQSDDKADKRTLWVALAIVAGLAIAAVVLVAV